MATMVSLNVALGVATYVSRVVDLGVVVGEIGQTDLNPRLEGVKEALHHILAGGEVRIEIVKSGVTQTVGELNQLLEKAYHESDEINKQAGYRLVMGL